LHAGREKRRSAKKQRSASKHRSASKLSILLARCVRARKKEGDAMFRCKHKDRPSGIPNLLRKVATGSHKRAGATTLVLLSLSGPATTPAVAQTPQKPNILFIMGDDIGWMQPSIDGCTPDHRRI
jgi:hypothetical protein